MNNFEFLRMVNIGQYLPLNSFLHRRDPRAMIIVYFLLVLATTIVSKPVGLIISVVVVLIMFFLGRIPFRYALRGLLPPLPVLLIFAFIQLFISIHPSGAQPLLQWKFIKIYVSGFISAGMLLLRFVALILELSLVSYTLSSSHLIQGLNLLLAPLTYIKIPSYDLVMVVQVTLRFIPFLAQTAERIAKAQASRGAEWGTRKGGLIARTRQLVPLVVPLFMTSLQRAETMALAMEARGYGSESKRSSMITLHFEWQDGLVILLAIAVSTAILLIR